jgi:hypothetical protein
MGVFLLTHEHIKNNKMFLPAPGKMLKEKLFQAIGFCIVKIQRNRYQ